MIDTKFTFQATIIFQGEVGEEETVTVESILLGIRRHTLEVDYISLENTIGNNFVIMVKPKGQEEKTNDESDIPF